jgi:MtrB/PioB family decaheme-associated outer membrane protein
MRTQSLGMVAAVLLTAAGARAQTPATASGQPDTPKPTPAASSEFAGPENVVDFAIRGTDFASGSDQARYQRYRDLRDGGTLDKFRFFKETDGYNLKLQADHVGYRDQRFLGSFNNFGSVKASFEWNQIPLNYSYLTETLYTQASPGVLVVPSAVQNGIQAGTLTLRNAVNNGAALYDTQSKRSTANFNLLYSATSHLDVNFTFRNTLRDGTQPYTASFGFSGVPDELAMPIDTRTTEFGSSVQYGDDRAYLKAGYEASLFRNNIPTLTWSNPNRATDSATAGPANGRMGMWPDTDSNTLSVSGGLNKLPGHSHATAYVSYSALSDNQALTPFTINSAIQSPALYRPNADADVRVTAMNLNFTSRPARQLWLSARYRQYDFDNRTTPFVVTDSVSYDYTAANGVNITSEPLGFTRHTFDADASYSPLPFLGFRGGYTRQIIDRTFRWVETTTEDTGRASVDITGMSWVTLRGVYEHSNRTGTSVDAAEILADGEQPTLGQYDIADRTRNRVTAIIIVTPVSMLSFNASAGKLKDEYPNSYFGLRKSENNVYSIGFDAVPLEDRVNFGVSYGYEKNAALQGSRYAAHVTSGFPPTFFNPAADWFDDSYDNAHTLNASVDVTKFIPKTDVKFSYDYVKGESSYVYSVPAGSAAPMALPQAIPATTNESNRGLVDLLYHLTSHLGAGFTYAYDQYKVSDFSLGPQANGLIPSPPTVATPSIMMLGYYYLPYTANTFWGRLTYRW